MSWVQVNNKKAEISRNSTTKVCSNCNIEKDKSEYNKCANRPSGVQAKCKKCNSKYKKERYWKNHELELSKMTKSRLKPENILQRKGYYEKNKDEYKSRYEKYSADEEKRTNRLERSKLDYHKNRDSIRERHKRNHNTPENKAKLREKHHIRKEVDVVYIIKRRLRFRLRHIINDLGEKKYKYKSALELLGCEMLFFKRYIEAKFTGGMSWDRITEIHIDHIKPCDKFDLMDINEQKKCFHYTNLQPLWKLDNLRKGSFYQEKIA